MRAGTDYATDAQALRDVMTAAGIRESYVRQQIMDEVLEICKQQMESPALVSGSFRYVDASLTEIRRDGDTYTVRLFGRQWTDRPAEFLHELRVEVL